MDLDITPMSMSFQWTMWPMLGPMSFNKPKHQMGPVGGIVGGAVAGLKVGKMCIFKRPHKGSHRVVCEIIEAHGTLHCTAHMG